MKCFVNDIFLLIKTICKANDMGIFVEKTFSIILKKICSSEIVVYDGFIILVTGRKIVIHVHLRFLFKL